MVEGIAMKATHAEAELVDAVIASDLTVKDLWLRYLALGGTRTRQELQDYLSDQSSWPTEDHDLLADALQAGEALSSPRDDDIKP